MNHHIIVISLKVLGPKFTKFIEKITEFWRKILIWIVNINQIPQKFINIYGSSSLMKNSRKLKQKEIYKPQLQRQVMPPLVHQLDLQQIHKFLYPFNFRILSFSETVLIIEVGQFLLGIKELNSKTLRSSIIRHSDKQELYSYGAARSNIQIPHLVWMKLSS